MNFQLPQLLPECKQDDKAFCELCRDKAKGAYTRKTMLRKHRVGGVSINFECPLGKAWTDSKAANPNSIDEPTTTPPPEQWYRHMPKAANTKRRVIKKCNCSRAKRNTN